MSTTHSGEHIPLRAQLRRIFTAGDGEQGRQLPLRTKVAYAVRVTRPEILPMAAGVGVGGVLLSAHSGAEIWTVPMLVMVLMIGAATGLLHVANGLADRWVDLEHKSDNARMVTDLGVRFVAWQIYLTTAAIGLAAVYLTWASGRLELLLIIPIGTLLLLEYSLPPWHFKSAGVWQIPATFFATMAFPGVVVLRLYDRPIEIAAALGMTGLGLTATGVFVANTAEDVPEDAEHGIMTSVRALGLRASFLQAIAQVGVGALLVIGSVVAIAGFTWTLIPYVIGLSIVLGYLGGTLHGIRGKSLDDAMAVVRPRARLFPIIVTLMTWSGVIPAAAVFFSR